MEYVTTHTGGNIMIEYYYMYDLTNLFGNE
jgi:hypothetical protein